MGAIVQSVDNTGKVTQNSEQDVDEEIRIASTLEKDTDGWQDDSKNNLADIAVRPSVSAIAISWRQWVPGARLTWR